MAFVKQEYTDRETIITAKNMNDIQDAILALEEGLFSVDDDRSGEVITITDAAKRGFRSFNIYGKTTQDGTPTPEAPVDLVSAGRNGSIGVTVAGKNLLPCSATGITSRGITFSVSSDGTVLANGTATENAYLLIGRVNLAPGKYFLSGDLSGSSSTHRLFITNGTKEYNNYTADREFEVTEGGSWSVSILIHAGTTASNITFYPMVRPATSIDSSYEPYKAQVMTISTPNGLPGIPVGSGGNYTDANGQQWVCDEVDFKRGVYLQRCMKLSANQLIPFHYYELTNCVRVGCNLTLKSVNYANGLSTHLPLISNYNMDTQHFYSADSALWIFAPVSELTERSKEGVIAWAKALGIEFVYALETPIETPLSAEEIAAYTALYTYKDHTTVSNDGFAYMELEYVMDAKKYIDGLFAGSIIPATVE